MGGRGEATLVTTFASSIPGIYPSVQLVHSPNLDLFVSFMRLLRNLSALPGSHERLPGNSGALPGSFGRVPENSHALPGNFRLSTKTDALSTDLIIYPRNLHLYPRARAFYPY